MRLLILGLDGLDPDLVERWRMDWFKLKFHGRHYVGVLKKLYTPIVWGSILTGLNVEEHGYGLRELREKRSREAFKSRVLRRLYLLRLRLTRRRLGVRKLLVKLGLVNPYPPAIMHDHLLARTFLEELKARGYSVAAIEVPSYNESRNEYYRSRIDALATAPFSRRVELVEEALEDTRERVERGVKCVEEGHDLIFIYTPLPDVAFHMAVGPTLKVKVWLRSVHYALYEMLRPLMKLARERGYEVLMLSDHGFDLRSGYHSEYGFWSTTVKPPYRPSSILDFHDLVMQLVEMPPHPRSDVY
ncbi:MAG: hypothetical protein DRJ67_01375 [Thermoprotei archaeon]|nr:MAG: hypothetical protein DRJ67_01375 [Thermoprotei archaeon]